jgi:DNA mismatch repair ATPase MutS
MNVAIMAGVPEEVVDRAEKKAAEMVNEKGWIGNVGIRQRQSHGKSSLIEFSDYEYLKSW